MGRVDIPIEVYMILLFLWAGCRIVAAWQAEAADDYETDCGS